jgi:hypothetical protein
MAFGVHFRIFRGILPLIVANLALILISNKDKRQISEDKRLKNGFLHASIGRTGFSLKGIKPPYLLSVWFNYASTHYIFVLFQTV